MAILNVSNQAELTSALKAARAGDTVALASGTYNEIALNKSQGGITITSASPDAAAVVNKITLRNSANIEIRDLKLDYEPGKSNDTPFWIETSRSVTFANLDVEGHTAGSFGDGVGIRIKNSSDVTVRDSEITNFRNGLYASNSTNVDVIGNDIRGMSNDGMLFGGMTDLLLQGNDFRDMNSPANLKHKDSIQFLTSAGEAGSKDVVIRENVIFNGEVSHGIFFTNSRYNGGDVNAFHRNILIEDNVVSGNHVHGISVNYGTGITIRDNVVGQTPGASSTPLINVSKYSTYVTIEGNKVASAPTPQNSSWTVAGNETSGGRKLHWYGDAGAPQVLAGGPVDPTPPPPPPPNPEPPGPVDPGAGDARIIDGVMKNGVETFFIGIKMMHAGTTRFLIEDFDLAARDEITFNNFGANAFRQDKGGNVLNVYNSGAAVRLDSALDFQELDAMSPAVSAATEGDDLILTITHRTGTAEVMFHGIGDEFRAADQPDLF